MTHVRRSSVRHRVILVLVLGILVGIAMRSSHRASAIVVPPGGELRRVAAQEDRVERNRTTDTRPAALAPSPISSPAAATRAQAAAQLTALYRAEQLTREIDLEQKRYGDRYWKSECTGIEFAALQVAREELVNRLTAEANQILTSLFPTSSSDAITLEPIFDANHAAPNVSGLSPASRQRLEQEILASRSVDAGELLALAARVLPSPEFEAYRSWNDPAASALRHQLVGFDASEGEFLAILRDGHANESTLDGYDSHSKLEAALGPTRYAEYASATDAALNSAAQDLHRFGLPLDHAGWLATTRSEAIAAVQQIWSDPVLADSQKKQKLAEVEQRYATAVAARLSLPAASLDGFLPSP
jgi:hypothetical protein